MTGRDRFEKRVTPALSRLLEEGERPIASGYGQIPASRSAHLLAGALASLATRHYWVVATDRRVILLRMAKMGTTPEFERAQAAGDVRILESRRTLIDHRLTLALNSDVYPLRFPLNWRADGEKIGAALTHSAG